MKKFRHPLKRVGIHDIYRTDDRNILTKPPSNTEEEDECGGGGTYIGVKETASLK